MEPLGGESRIPLPSVRVDHTSGFDVLRDEGFQILGGCIRDPAHPDTSDAGAILLGGNDHQRLGLSLPSANTLFHSSNKSLVDFDSTDQSIAARPNHGSPQLVQPRPSPKSSDWASQAAETSAA